MYKVLDLFCGCGGMSWGLHKKGFRILAGIDIWDIALKTYKHNHKTSKVYNMDLSKTCPDLIMKDLGLQKEELDVMIGGPPCQGFSKNTPAYCRFFDDPRNQMYRSFLHFVETFIPKVVIIENVAEIYNAYNGIVRKEIIRSLKSYVYYLEAKIVNMANYGIPQRRRRCFFFASRRGYPSFPKEHKISISAWDAISDLPVVEQGEGYDGMPYPTPPKNQYQEHMRKNSKIVNNHIARGLSPLQTARIASILPGQSLKDMPSELQVKSGYSGAYGRLDYEMLAPTITRWVFHIGSGRYAHPREIRGLTMREAARLQSFSDDFYFYGSNTNQAGQIGNAVPPLFMEQLADNITLALENKAPSEKQLCFFE